MTSARRKKNPPLAALLPDARAATPPKGDRYPMRLALLPGLRWAGTLSVLGNWPEGFPVAFDAVIVNAKPGDARHVFDHAILTGEQLRGWTGVSPADMPPPFKREP